jgi:hypothetical protein
MEKAKAEPVIGTDRGFNVTPRESEQTSIRSFFTRELAELLKEEIANEREIVCIFQQHSGLGIHRLGEGPHVRQEAANAYRKGSKGRQNQQGKNLCSGC